MPLHPSIVHLPIALAVLMPLISLALLVSWLRGWLPKRSWWLAVGLQAALVGSSLLALRTGHADGERVEETKGEAAVEAHEEAAEVFVWASGGMLAIAAAAALTRRERASRLLAGLTVAASLGVLALGYRTGHAGGKLVYGGAAAVGQGAEGGQGGEGTGPEASTAGEQEHEEDGDED